MSGSPGHSVKKPESPPTLRLLLFVAGDEPNSCLARQNLKRICDVNEDFICDTKEINVLDDYDIALEHGVLVTPCLIVLKSNSRTMVVGTLQDLDRIRQMLLT